MVEMVPVAKLIIQVQVALHLLEDQARPGRRKVTIQHLAIFLEVEVVQPMGM